MENLLFFLWMLFFPIVEDAATWIVWKTRGKPCPENEYDDGWTAIGTFLLYIVVGYLLYE